MDDVTDLSIVGEGAASIVKHKPRDWITQSDPHLFACDGCAFVSFSDFAINGSKDDPGFAGHDVRRMHGIQVLNSHDVTVQRVSFTDTWGDGVEVFGQPGITEDVTISANDFVDNGRSGVGVQGGTRFVDIVGNHFEQVRGQDIDFEPTGSDVDNRPAPTDFLIQDNTIEHSNTALSVAIGGQKVDNRAERIQFLDNIVTDGIVRVYNSDDVLVEGNTISSDVPQPEPIFLVQREVSGLTVRDNTIEGSTAGKSVVLVGPIDTSLPDDVTDRAQPNPPARYGRRGQESTRPWGR